MEDIGKHPDHGREEPDGPFYIHLEGTVSIVLRAYGDVQTQIESVRHALEEILVEGSEGMNDRPGIELDRYETKVEAGL